MSRPRTLRRRIVVAMVGFGAAVCLVYSALSFLFVYAVEDAFFETLLANEAEYVARELAAGRDGRPRLPFVQLYDGWAGVPAEVRGLKIRERGEVAGADGRHYHVRRVPLAGREAWLVAEVSPLLVVRPMRGRLLTILLPATALVLLGASLVAALVARRSVRQLTALVEAVERGGAFPDSLRTTVNDHEVRVLAEALESALDRVHSMLAREKAFAGDVSHELRTPLAVIRGAAELLDRRDLDPTARAQVGRIREAARSSEEIIDLLLALAREESAHEPPVPVPLLALVEKLVLRHPTDVDVQVDIPPSMRITAPPAAAEIVIANLISNALRHGGGGTVAIAGRDRSLSIRNRGAGVRPGGRGIGLTLVQRLCVACGFTLAIDSSDAETTATITF